MGGESKREWSFATLCLLVQNSDPYLSIRERLELKFCSLTPVPFQITSFLGENGTHSSLDLHDLDLQIIISYETYGEDSNIIF